MFPTVYGEHERRGYRWNLFREFVSRNWDEIFCVLAFFATLFFLGLMQ